MPEAVVPVRDLQLEPHPDVYWPSDDSLMLAGAVEDLPRGRILEVGTGTGFVALVAARAGHEVVATDRNPAAVRLARRNARRNGLRVSVVRADLLRGLRPARFDAIAFNPPYLPTAPADHVPGPLDAAFDGGATGRAVLERFVRGLPDRAPPAYVVVSSLQDEPSLEALFRDGGLPCEVVATAALPHERLRVVRVLPSTRKG